MRSRYWSCSKFADWLRGTKKLDAGTAEEWDEWTTASQNRYNVRFWLAEEGLDYLQKVVYFVPDTIHSIKYYINNRWVTRTHCLTAHPRDIKPGNWRDVGDRFLPCLFNELVDFVEVELAWWHIAWDGEARKQFQAPWYASGWFRWRTWRNPECGLANLEWQRNLRFSEDEGFEPGDPNIGKLTTQAVNAQEVLDLYTWWTVTRPARPDPYDVSGWTAICERRRVDGKAAGKSTFSSMFLDDDTKAKKRETNKSLAILHKVEAAYEKEDEAMMIRLIKVRRSLWT